jgi:DNA polymerase
MGKKTDWPPLVDAIRQRFEADRILGVRVAPISFARGGGGGSGGTNAPEDSPFGLTGSKSEQLSQLDRQFVQACKKCVLHESRTKTVFGQGSAEARLVFVGEGPGFNEDQQGLAFVGRAGSLLTDIIKAMQLSRDEVFICNVVKCRPPQNRTPAVEEVAACSPYLFEQLRVIRPEIIVALGAPAAKTLLNSTEAIGKLRGRFHDFHIDGVDDDIKLMATYHPAYLLRNPNDKRKVWEDMKLVMGELGIAVPE